MAKLSGTACRKSLLDSLDNVKASVRGQKLEFNSSQCKYLSQEMEESAMFLRSEEVKQWISKTTKAGSPVKAALEPLYFIAKRAKNLVLECTRTVSKKHPWPKRALHLFAMKDHVQNIVVHFRWWASILSRLVINVPLSIPEKVKSFQLEFEQGLEANQKLDAAVLEDRKQLLSKVSAEIQACTEAVKPKKSHTLSLLKQVRIRLTDKDDGTSVELNEFTQLGLLGSGGFGVVNHGKWCGVDCVLKQYQSFKRDAEVTSLKVLPHPHIVRMYRHWTNEKIESKYKSHIVMERMDKDLEELIEESSRKRRPGRPFSDPVAIDIMLQIINGVRYMHSKEIVHRDLKPKNVLVRMWSESQLEVKLADLGTAREDMMSSNAEALTHKAGTTVYRAPELASKDYTEGPKNFPRKLDVWSFGIMCFRIFTGKQPFEGIQGNERIQRYVEDGGRPVIPEDCPDYLKFIMERCWDENPQHRPRVNDLWSMLRVAHLRSLGILAQNYDLFMYRDLRNQKIFRLGESAPSVSFTLVTHENSLTKAATSVVTVNVHDSPLEGASTYYYSDYHSPYYYSNYRPGFVDHDNQPITNPNYMKSIKLQ